MLLSVSWVSPHKEKHTLVFMSTLCLCRSSPTTAARTRLQETQRVCETLFLCMNSTSGTLLLLCNTSHTHAITFLLLLSMHSVLCFFSNVLSSRPPPLSLPVDFLRNLFSGALGLGSPEKVLDELTLEGVARYIKSGKCESSMQHHSGSI